MRELRATQYHPEHGQMTIVLRVDGSIIFMKTNNSPQKNQMVEQLRKGGAIIEESSKGWLRIDMFKNNPHAKLGGFTVDVEEMTPEEIEKILAIFYAQKYTEAHYKVEVKEL